MTSFDDYLSNWVRWHTRRRPVGRCGSLEGGWSSKQYWDAPPRTSLGKVDELAALKVEEAWKSLVFVEKMILKWHFVFVRSPWAICRSLRQRGIQLSASQYPAALQIALDELALALSKKKDNNPRIAVVCVMSPPWEGETSARERAA